MKPSYEIVELYPKYGKKGEFIVFTAHVYFLIPPIEFDIRGYKVKYVVSEKNEVYDPTGLAYDFEDKKVARYPIFKLMGEEGEKLMENLKGDLEKAAAEKYAIFRFTENFPRNYKGYKNFLKEKNQNQRGQKKSKNYSEFKKKPMTKKKPF